MTENSFENKALSNLAETCNAENGTYRGGDSAVEMCIRDRGRTARPANCKIRRLCGMSEYRLVMKGVVKTFPGVKALDHAQLELRPGKVMALMGENGAGKSTLMKCMFGIYKMDEGEIEYEGEKVVIANPLEALGRGIAMVHQELQPIPARTVAENIWLGRYPTKKVGPITIVDHSKMYADTDALLKKLKLQINSHAKLGSLSIAQMQMVEIAKAVSANCKVLILDEPTSSLTANEVESLFRIMRELKEQGVALVYISHKMDEIKVIADEVTIMRDGHCLLYTSRCV